MAHFRGGLWNPPPDPEKPPCPYTLGFTVNIMQHKPRAPFGGREYGRADWPYDPSREWLQSVTQTKHVLQHPPPDSNPTPSGSSTPQIARLVITDLIAVEDGRGAQIAVCSITPQAVEADCKPYMAVAKIFDPLYYSFRNQIARHRPSDVVFDAETDYCREAAAYEHLQKTGQTGLFAPEYHGSWTFNLPICYEGSTLTASALRDLCEDPRTVTYDIEYRLAVLSKMLDGYIRQHHRGLIQRDLAPRNIILVPGSQDTPEPQPVPRVVLIDYNIAIVFERTLTGERGFCDAKLPTSPLNWYWGDTFEEFESWRPPEWNSNSRPVQEWLLKEFGGERAALYEPPTESLHSILHGSYPRLISRPGGPCLRPG